MVSLSLSGWIKAAPRGLENFHCVAVLFYCIGSGVCVFLTCILSVFAACLLLMFLFWLSAAPFFFFFNLQQASVTVFVLDFLYVFLNRHLLWSCSTFPLMEMFWAVVPCFPRWPPYTILQQGKLVILPTLLFYTEPKNVTCNTTAPIDFVWLNNQPWHALHM